MRRRQRDAAPLKAAEAGCVPAPARLKRQRDTPEGPPRLPGDRVLHGGSGGDGPSLGPGAGAKEKEENSLSCTLPARPRGSNACRLRDPWAALRGAPAEPDPLWANRGHPIPPREPVGSGMPLQGARGARAPHHSHATGKVFMGPLGKKEDEHRAKLKITSQGIEKERATSSTPAVALGAKSFSVQLLGAAVGHLPRPRRDPRLCMDSLTDLFFHVCVREQFRYEFCLREPNPASLYPAPRTIPKNKSFLNSQTRRPT